MARAAASPRLTVFLSKPQQNRIGRPDGKVAQHTGRQDPGHIGNNELEYIEQVTGEEQNDPFLPDSARCMDRFQRERNAHEQHEQLSARSFCDGDERITKAGGVDSRSAV